MKNPVGVMNQRLPDYFIVPLQATRSRQPWNITLDNAPVLSIIRIPSIDQIILQAPAIADFGIKLIHAFFTDLFTSGLPFQLLR